MNETELHREIALRADVPESTSRAVVAALRDLLRQGRVGDDVLWAPLASPTDPEAVERLIEAARRHPLGVDFLLCGYLGSVAAEFGAHAFTVEAARERLKGNA